MSHSAGVFYCGMPVLAKELRRLSYEMSHKTSTRFVFHKELFWVQAIDREAWNLIFFFNSLYFFMIIYSGSDVKNGNYTCNDRKLQQ